MKHQISYILWIVVNFIFINCKCDIQKVPLSSNSSAALANVQSVSIDVINREVIIELKENRRCENPTFLARLSGVALYKLSPRLSESNNNKKQHRFSYPSVAVRGLYFLETIILYCENFDGDRPEMLCLVDPWRGDNIINAPYSVILEPTNAAGITSSNTSVVSSPHWAFQSQLNQPTLVHTRYQQKKCDSHGVCVWDEHEEGGAHHQQYDWVNGPNWRTALTNLHREHTTVCFVGASHERFLSLAARALDRTGLGLAIVYIISRYPLLFNPKHLFMSDCDYAVIGYGQWPASYNAVPPYTTSRFETEMRKMLSTVVAPAYEGHAAVSLISMNYNGFGAYHMSCPPFDHRSPPMVDAYNSILHRLTAQAGVPYIDLGHIMGPMWDSAADYNHPGRKVFTAEAEWILHSLFTRPIQPSSSTGQRLVRFSPSGSIYLLRGSLARPFPDMKTFEDYQYDLQKVETLPKSALSSFRVGDSLVSYVGAAAQQKPLPP